MRQRNTVTQAAAYLLDEKRVRNNEAFFDAIIGYACDGRPLFKSGITFDLGHGALKAIFIKADKNGKLLDATVIEYKTKGKTKQTADAYNQYLEQFKQTINKADIESQIAGAKKEDDTDLETLVSKHFNDAIAGAYEDAKEFFGGNTLPSIRFSMGGLQQQNIKLSLKLITKAVDHIGGTLAESDQKAATAESDHAGIQRAFLDLWLNSPAYLQELRERVAFDIRNKLPTTIASGAPLSARLEALQKPDCRALDVDENPPDERFKKKVPLNVIRKDILLAGSDTQRALLAALSEKFPGFSYENVAIIGAQPGSSNPGYFLVNKQGLVLLLSCSAEEANTIVDKHSNPQQLQNALFEIFKNNSTLLSPEDEAVKLYHTVARLIGRHDAATLKEAYKVIIGLAALGATSLTAGGIMVALTPAVLSASSPLTAMFTDPAIATFFTIAIASVIVASCIGISMKLDANTRKSLFEDAHKSEDKEPTVSPSTEQ